MTAIFAHRGCPGVPTPRENTVGAFVAAGQAGADGVELDVWAIAEGALAVHHDRRIPGAGDVTNISPDELPPSVPLLDEALAACRAAGLAVNVEMKCSGRCEVAASALARSALGDTALVSSFHPGCLAAFRALERQVPVGLLVDWRTDAHAAIGAAVRLGCATLHPFVTQVDGALVDAARAAGLGLHVWTVNADADLEAMGRLGVDAVITDRVAAARAVLAPRRNGEGGRG